MSASSSIIPGAGNYGFTLIELLIIIAVIAILASVVFVALDPLTRFQDARDVARATDLTAVISAIKIDQVDNQGTYLPAIAATVANDIYMIGTSVSGCDDQNLICDASVTSDTHCLNLAGLMTEGYLPEVPVSPNGQGSWSDSLTGYVLRRAATGIITITACESENTTGISVSR